MARRQAEFDIPVALQLVDQWQVDMHARGTPFSGNIVFYFLPPGETDESGAPRTIQITREHLEGGDKQPGWPKPGTYEIEAQDGENAVATWRARHYSEHARPEHGDRGGTTDLDAARRYHADNYEHYQSQLGSLRRELDGARKREDDARGKLQIATDALGKVQAEMANLRLETESAKATAETAKRLQREAEERYDELEAEHASLTPHIEAGVNEAFGLLTENLGVDRDKLASSRRVYSEAFTQAIFCELSPEALEGLLQHLVEGGYMPWELCQSLFKVYVGADPGPVPLWQEGAQGSDSASASATGSPSDAG